MKRISNIFELSSRKRFSDGWQFMTSYVWQRLEGNYDGVFQNSTGQLDPNINSAFDYADFLVNAEGRLTNDRTHQFKFDGSYEFQKGPSGPEPGPVHLLALGHAAECLRLLVRVSELGVLPGAARHRRTWTGRTGRPTSRRSIPSGSATTTGSTCCFDVFNLFNRQKPIQLDERYNLALHGRCSAGTRASRPTSCNGDNGWLTQPDTLTPASAR